MFFIVRRRGKDFLGYSNSVPGVFHVRTTFHFFPLCPEKSYLFLHDKRNANLAMEIPLNDESIKLARVRAFFFYVSLLSLFGAFPTDDGFIVNPALPITVCVISFVLGVYFTWHKSNTCATYEKASAICSNLKPSTTKFVLQRKVDKYFNKSIIAVETIIEDEAEEFDNEAPHGLNEEQEGSTLVV